MIAFDNVEIAGVAEGLEDGFTGLFGDIENAEAELGDSAVQASAVQQEGAVESRGVDIGSRNDEQPAGDVVGGIGRTGGGRQQRDPQNKQAR